MGIYDRDYYRREGPSFLGTLAEQGRVTNWLIGINIACFILQMMTRTRIPTAEGFVSPFTDALIFDLDKILHGQVWRLVTYAFLHSPDSIWHIVFNMLLLFWFGRQVEDTVGGREYLWFYLVGALLGGLGYTAACLLHLHGVATRMGWVYPQMLGASGAVTAVLVLAACYHPRQIIYLFFILPVPIWGFIIFSIAVDAFNLFGQSRERVATSAHLAGAAFGFCYYKLGWRLSGWTGWLTGLSRIRSRPRLRLYREGEGEDETPTPRPAAAPAPAARLLEDEQLEAQVDAILEKIPRVGMEGLTENERQVLVRASEAIKRKRS